MRRIVGNSLPTSARTPWIIAALVAGAGAGLFAGAPRIAALLRKQRAQPITALPADEIDQELQDSFPASDPPSFTPVSGIGRHES